MSKEPPSTAKQCFHWKIRPQLAAEVESPALKMRIHAMEQVLKHLIPDAICFEDRKDFVAWVDETLPLVKWTDPLTLTIPDTLPLFFLCRASKVFKAESFFFNFIKNWLIPKKETSILSFEHLYFHFETLLSESFLVVRAELLIEDATELGVVQHHLPMIAREIAIACQSSTYAKYFLETKGLSYDFKSNLIHQDLIRLMERYPYLLDQTLFTEMGRLLALSTKEFVESRSHRHIAKLVCTHHVMRRNLTRAFTLFPEERHLQLKVAQTRLQFLFGTKPVLGLIVGICLLDRYEFVDEKHLLLAVQKLLPSVQAVKGSFYAYQAPQETIRTLYLEIEKKNGEPFSMAERKILKEKLLQEVKVSVEKLIPAVFMIRNEEEIMKNILILSQELRYFSDLPQVMISLEQQSTHELTFTIVLVRILHKHSIPLESLFQKSELGGQFIPDRVQIVGYLRKKYPKEANIFRLQINKEPSLLRADSSVNFYMARQKMMHLLNDAVGEVRDYNGGMILQQVEQFSQFKEAFLENPSVRDDLLEDFFYALSPIEMQATLSLPHLQTLFGMLLEATEAPLPKKESHFLKINKKSENVFVIIRTREPAYRESLLRHLNAIEIFPKSLCSTHVNVRGSYCTGYIYECADSASQNHFIATVENALQEWLKKINSLQILRLSFRYFPISLDPRIGGDEHSERLLELLFEGLMRLDEKGKPSCAIAQSYEISQDLKRYTFKLRKSYWANGDPVTAHDFEYAWKKSLDPEFASPFAYLFYPIKNAKGAKEGNIAIDQIGVKTLDDETLQVDLEHPAPYFLELTAFTLYAPVHHLLDKAHPDWTQREGKDYVCNGPFRLKKRNAMHCDLVKNPLYWNVERVRLDQVLISHNNPYTQLQMFNNDEIDWLGRPITPWDSSFTEGAPEQIESYAAPRVFWYVFNVKRFPFDHPKLRKAFAYGIDRKRLVEALQYAATPAGTLLPLGHTQQIQKGIQDYQEELAATLFEEALMELGIERKNFPVITLLHAHGEIRDKTAQFIQQEWQRIFGVECRIESHEWSIVFEKMTQGDFQIGGMNWKSWVNDPIYTLDAFRYASEKVNFAKWENREYQKLLESADHEVDTEKRLALLAAAEEILLKEWPVIPIFYDNQQFKRKKRLHVHVNPETGRVDFSTASIF